MVSKTDEFSIDKFSDDELIEEIKYRYLEHNFNNDLDDYDNQDLIDRLILRGYYVCKGGTKRSINTLYSTYLTTNDAFFQKALKKFFEDELDVFV